jgi:peptidase M23-like protein
MDTLSPARSLATALARAGSRRCPRPAVLLTAWLLQSAGAWSGPIETEGLALPVDCALGQTCWIVNHVDVDPLAGAVDFRCQPRTYDGHDGVDFAVRDLAAMRAGVSVLASAEGTVRNVRDRVDDVTAHGSPGQVRIDSQACGNGVVIQHAGDWETQYCHLRRGSVRVKPGDRVARGAKLGLLGLSGATEFPHLHFAVRHKGTPIDPFTGAAGQAGCGLAGRPLWRTDRPIPYEEVALYNAGFAGEQPDAGRIRDDGPDALPVDATSPALVLWVDILGVQPGDTIRLTITGPDGSALVDRQQTIDRTQARRFLFAGRRASGPWPPGVYRGEVRLVRTARGPALERRISRTVTIGQPPGSEAAALR